MADTETEMKQCPGCGDPFDVGNGQLLSDYDWHVLRGCLG